MSTAPAPAAGAATAPDPGTVAPPATIKTVPADIRRRVLGEKSPPYLSPAETEAKAKADREAADKKKKDDEAAAAAKKKADDDAAATAAGAPPVEKVKKVKAGPPLPDKPAPAGSDSQAIGAAVREAMAEHKIQTDGVKPALSAEEQAEVELAKFAETKNPQRYAGFADKVSGYFTAHEQLRAAKAAELGGPRSPEFRDYIESDEYKGWVRENRPTYDRGDREKLKEDAISNRARDDAKRELAPKLKELERRTAELQHAPAIAASTNALLRVMIAVPEGVTDPALEGFSKDPMKFGQEHPEEARVIAAEAGEGLALIEEVYRLDHDLVDFDPKANPRQQEIRRFMVEQNDAMRQKHPSGLEMQDGKILVDAKTYEERGLSGDPRYRVFSADEIAGMLATTRNGIIVKKLEARRDGVAKSIYARAPVVPVAAPGGQGAPAGDDPPAPGATTSAAPGTRVKPAQEKVGLGRKYA